MEGRLLPDSKLSLNVNADQLAPPGISGDLWSVQCKPDTPDDVVRAKIADQSERDFEVRGVFFRDTGFSRDVPSQADFEAGTSFFGIAEGEEPGWFESAGIRYQVVLNASREIAGLRSSVRARSVDAARRSFAKGLAAFVDHLSYIANTPLIVAPPACNDMKNLTWVFGYMSPYSAKIINPGRISCHVELAPVYALYREAKNATSPFYRFFCYYKILEGVFHALRPRLFERARKAGIELETAKELIPVHDELAADVVRRPVKEYFDNVLQKEFRDAVAHYVLDSGSILSPSEPDVVAKFNNIILPSELCCRTVVEQHVKYLDQLEVARPRHLSGGT